MKHTRAPFPRGRTLTQAQRQALVCAQHALEMIKHQVEWSEEQQETLRRAYDILSWQTSALGVGIEPPHDYAPQDILHAAAHFQRQLDERYPLWQSLLTVPTETQPPEPMSTMSGDDSTHPEEQERHQSSRPDPTGEDCRCTDHLGPHWLRDDYQWYKTNLAHLQRCARHIQCMYELYLKRETDPTAARRAWQQREGAILAFDAFATEEIPRLQEKIWEMQSRKITRISYETLGPGFHNLGARERALYAAIRATALKMSSAGEQSRHSPNEEASRAIALNRSQGETIP